MALLHTAALGRTARQYVLAMSLVYLSLLIFQAYFIFYLQQSGLSYFQMSVIYAVNLAFCALLSLPMGNVADRYGRRRALVVGILIIAFSMLIYAFTRDFLIFLVAEVFWAIGWALINCSNEAWVFDQLSKEGRAAEGSTAFTLMMSLSYVLGVVGGIIASALVVVSLNMPFLGAAVIALVCAVVVWKTLAENYGMETVTLRRILRDCVGYYRGHAGLQLLTAGETCRYVAGVIYMFLYQPYLVATGLGADMLGLYFSLLMLSSAAGAFLAPRLASRFGHHQVMMLSGGGLFVAFALLTMSPGLVASCALFALCGLSYGLGWPPLMVWRNDLVPDRIRASALSLFASITYLAAAVMTTVLGGLLDATSPLVGFLFAATLALLSVPLYLGAHRRSRAQNM